MTNMFTEIHNMGIVNNSISLQNAFSTVPHCMSSNKGDQMQPQITGRKIEITEAIREYIGTKYEKLERHFDHITSAHFILDIEKLNHIAEARIHIPGHEVFVQTQDQDMYAAIDSLIDKLDRQIIKHKSKMQNHSHAPHHQVDHIPTQDDD